MRLWSICFAVVSLASFAHGQNFFSGLFNIFNRFNPFRPQQSSRPSPVFRPSNIFRPRPTFQQPVRTVASVQEPQPVRQQLTPSQPFESVRSQPAPAPQFQSFQAPSSPTQTFQNNPIQPSRPNPPQVAVQSGRGNHIFQGRSYLLSWKEGQNEFSWSQARNYCSRKGMRIVSLDSSAKKEHFLQLVASEGVTFMWAGGRISSDKRTLTWENGRRETIARGSHPWSFTGLRGPQPDGQGSEDCLAILNNLYNDGVKFHDVGCSHTKPTVCEA
eukprot:TRINITY_DN15006_c0_g2_i1.p1 TRINITY_DN15006_c0_g2~~TRINITY_DN15006_c0_g2_i1.p1  ORF type:complete len:272 (+),score=47.87 TRINITY_DN15006_c0_g2_i1:82-897(+)